MGFVVKRPPKECRFACICSLWTFTFSPVHTQLSLYLSSAVTPTKLFLLLSATSHPRGQCLRLTCVSQSLHMPVCPHVWGELIALGPKHSNEHNKRHLLAVCLASFYNKSGSDILSSALHPWAETAGVLKF